MTPLIRLDDLIDAFNKMGIGFSGVARLADIDASYLRRMKSGRAPVSRKAISKLNAAHRRAALGMVATHDEQLYWVFYQYRLVFCLLVGDMRRADRLLQHAPERRATQDREWMAAAHYRRLAIYIMHTEFAIEMRRIAEAIDISVAAVSYACSAVEEAREDDSELDDCIQSFSKIFALEGERV